MEYAINQSKFQRYLIEQLNISPSEARLLETEIRNYSEYKKQMKEISFGKKFRAGIERKKRNIKKFVKDNAIEIGAIALTSLVLLGPLAAVTKNIMESDVRKQFYAIQDEIRNTNFDKFKNISEPKRLKMIATTKWLENKAKEKKEISFATLTALHKAGFKSLEYPSYRLYMSAEEDNERIQSELDHNDSSVENYLEQLEEFNNDMIKRDQKHGWYDKMAR